MTEIDIRSIDQLRRGEKGETILKAPDGPGVFLTNEGNTAEINDRCLNGALRGRHVLRVSGKILEEIGTRRLSLNVFMNRKTGVGSVILGRDRALVLELDDKNIIRLAPKRSDMPRRIKV